MTKHEELAKILREWEDNRLGVTLADVVDQILSALNEPTEAMLRAARETSAMKAINGQSVLAYIHGSRLPKFDPPPFTQAYQAMINSIKEETR